MNLFYKIFLAIGLICVTQTMSFSQLNLDSMFNQNFQFCDYDETATRASSVEILPIGLLVQMGTGDFWILEPNGQFSRDWLYTHTEYGDLVGGFFVSEIVPSHVNFRVQQVNDNLYKRIWQNSYGISYGTGSEIFSSQFQVRDYNIDGTYDSYNIDLTIGDESYPTRQVIYNLDDTYYIYSSTNNSATTPYGETEKHLLTYDENTEEIQVIDLPMRFSQFIINNNKQIFFQSDSVYYKLNSDLNYEEVLSKSNLRFLGSYGQDELIFFSDNKFEIYNDSLTELKNTIDYTASNYSPMFVDNKDIYHYQDGHITKISENGEQSIVYQVSNDDETLASISGIKKIGDRFCIYGRYESVPYLHLFDDTITSLSCNPIDECTEIVLESITPISMKAENTLVGFGSDVSQVYDMKLNANFEFTNNDTISIESIKLTVNNLNHNAPSPLDYLPDLRTTAIRATSLELPAGETTIVNLDFEFYTKLTTIALQTPPLETSFDWLTSDLEIIMTDAQGIKTCIESKVRLKPRDLIDYVDQDCDGFIAMQDCNDLDSLINPLAIEIPDNEIDENCDSIISSVVSMNGDSEIQLNPNPTSGMIIIESELSKFNYEVFSLSGEMMASGGSTSEVDLSSLQSGLYFIIINSNNKENSFVKKIIKI